MASFLPFPGRIRRDAALRTSATVLPFAALLLLLAAPAYALRVDTSLWVTNGTVNAVAVSGSTLYVGGLFDRVGPASGAAVPFGAVSGLPPASFPQVCGTVQSIVPDGSGGWFLGGRFSAVGEIPRANLAHVLANGTVDSWNPGSDLGVFRMALSGGTLYVGGAFNSLGGVARSMIGAIDASTGAVTAWDPGATGGAPTQIRSLTVVGGLVYVGGSFTNIGGQPRSHIAALDATTGVATSWNPGADGDVYTIAPSGTTLYVGGAFQNIGGASRKFIAALDATNDAATAWDPDALGAVTSLLVSGTRVYAGGGFALIGGQNRAGLAALDATLNTGNVLAWDPGIDASPLPVVQAMTLSGNTLYVGGAFTTAGGKARSNVAAFDVSPGADTVLAWNPDLNGQVLSMAASGGTVYTGGTFTGIGGVVRSNLAAIDLTTGHATAWKPDPDGEVDALAVGNGVVYAGGGFTYVGALFRRSLVAIDPATGLATSWSPNADGTVTSLLVNGSTIYAGGGFSFIGGQTRNHLAALSAATGLATVWDPNAGDWVSALALSGSRIYAGGLFTTMGGVSHPKLAAIDTLGAGTVAAWNPAPNGNVTAVVVKGGVVYVAGFFNSIGGAARSGIAALDPSTGNATSWQSDAFVASVRTLLETGNVLYAGGDFIGIGGVPRARIAALDETTGAPASWAPAVDPSSVRCLAAHNATIFAGGTFRGVDGHGQANLAAIVDVTTPTLVLRFDATAETGSVRLAWQLASEVAASDVSLERADREAGPWTTLALATRPAGDVEEAIDTGVEAGRSYWYRLSVRDASGATTRFGPIEAQVAGGIVASGLTQVSPNPTAGPARIEYAVARREAVHLSVVDVAGREVAVLIDGPVDPGRGSAQWNGTSSGGALRAGVFFVRWRSPGRSMERRVALLR